MWLTDNGAGTFHRAILTRGTAGGINACQIRGSHFIGDVAIEWSHGGGNFFTGNVFQSLSGTGQAPTGFALVLNGVQPSATVSHNYIERFEAVVFLNSTDRNSRDSSTVVQVLHATRRLLHQDSNPIVFC